MESTLYELFGGRTLHLAFYKDVKNSAALHQAVLSQQVDVAFINARLVVDPFQVHAAAARALMCDQQGKLTTKSLHAELVFNLSGTRNVMESFRRFGLTDTCDKILLCIFDASAEAIDAATQLIEGTVVPLSELGSHLDNGDLTTIKKFYKIQELELKTSNIVDAIVSRIATKSCSK